MKKIIHALAALLMFVPAYADEPHMPPKPVEWTLALEMGADGQPSGSVFIKVPHFDDAKPLLCFLLPHKQLASCFYRDPDTGEVVVLSVQTNIKRV